MPGVKWIEPSRIAIAVCSALFFGVVLWSGLRLWRGWGVDRYAAHLIRQTELAEDGRAVAAVRQLAVLGAAGDMGLVKALNARRARVASAAEEELLAVVDRCQDALDGGGTGSEALLPRRAAALATTLAEQVDQFGPRARRAAARIAMRLLRLGEEDFAAAEWSELIAGCERVIEIAEVPSPVSILAVGALRSTRETRDREPLSPERATALSERPTVPDGAATEMEVVAPLPECASDRHVQQRRAPRPERSLQAGPSRFDAGSAPDHSPGYQAEWRPPADRDRRVDAPTTCATAVPAQSEPTAGAVRRARAAIDGLTLRQLMERLHDPDRAVAAAAEGLLRERGLSLVEVEVARRLASPDVGDRLRLVDDLPHTRGIDARPWLFWLAVDADADVRLGAMTLLATTSDPAVRDRVRNLAAGDRDRRILALSERLAVIR